jgi:hypothetical protein
MDVSALYTSIPHDDGIAATRTALSSTDHNSPEDIIRLIHFILTHNAFTFDGTHYLQTHGTAMGTRFAPQYANLFMHQIETDFLTKQTHKPALYTRYIDDIFFIWTEGEERLKEFYDAFNSHHPTIKLTMEYSPQSVSFLDTLITIKDNKLISSLYRKPTDNLTMLHSSSFHPRHVKEAIPYGQALRIHRICTEESDRDQHLNTLRSALIRNGYDTQLITRQFRRAISQDRSTLLTRNQRHTTEPRIPFVVTYFPGADNLRKTLRRFQHLIDDDPYLSQVLPSPPILAVRQPPNLKKILVRSKLPTLIRNPDGLLPCNRPRCLTCQLIDTDTAITRNNTTHNIQGSYTCNSTGLVYLIRCRHDCPDAWYIGETKQTLRERMNGHRATIRQGSTLPIPDHFNKPGHSNTDIRLNVLQGNVHSTQPRLIAEQKLIAKFRTHSDGLNRDLGFMARYK